LGALYRYLCSDSGEIWHGRGPLLHAKFHPHRCNVSPLRDEKPQNRPLSNLNTGELLPVMISLQNLMSSQLNWQPGTNKKLTTKINRKGPRFHDTAVCTTGNGATPCQYIDTTRKAIDCATTLPLTFLHDETLQQTFRLLLSKLSKSRQI